MKKLCCYSLSLPGGTRPDLVTQLVTSVDSLRTHNGDVGIVVFAFGDLPDGLEEALARYDARVWHLEPYEARLAKLSAHGWPALSHYPLLHKCLNFTEISSLQPDQVLMLDCDTLFLDDVDRLFDGYSGTDCVAREEVGSRRNHHGYDPTMIDEDALAELGAHLGSAPAPPFNMGVVLLNNGLWDRLSGLDSVYVNYAWRFFVWMASNPPDVTDIYGEALGVDLLRSNPQTIAPSDAHQALPYPSANRWILDEVALWLTLGHLQPATFGDFSRDDVAQNGEFDADDQSPEWVVCHYFSQNMDRIAEWAQQRALTRVNH